MPVQMTEEWYSEGVPLEEAQKMDTGLATIVDAYFEPRLALQGSVPLALGLHGDGRSTQHVALYGVDICRLASALGYAREGLDPRFLIGKDVAAYGMGSHAGRIGKILGLTARTTYVRE